MKHFIVLAEIHNLLRQTAALGLCLFITVAPICAEDTQWEQMNEQGLKAIKDNNLEEAETIFKQAEEKLTNSGHQDADLATVKHHMAEIYEKQGKYQDAENYYKEALQLRQENLGDDSLLTARTMVNLGRMYEKELKMNEAADTFNKAGVIIDKSLGGQYPGIGQPADLVKWLDNQAEKEDKVPSHATKQADRLEKQHGANHPEASDKLNNLGDFYRAHGKFDQAEELYKRAAYSNPLVEHSDPAAAKRFVDLATLYQHQGRMDEAEKYFERAESLLESTNAPLDKRGSTLNTMARFYEAKGDNEKAEQFYKDALEAREQFAEEKPFGGKSTEKPVAETLTDYAKFLHKIGKEDAADKLDTRAHDILDSLKP